MAEAQNIPIQKSLNDSFQYNTIQYEDYKRNLIQWRILLYPIKIKVK